MTPPPAVSCIASGAWKTTFADLTAIILCFFVLIFSMRALPEAVRDPLAAGDGADRPRQTVPLSAPLQPAASLRSRGHLAAFARTELAPLLPEAIRLAPHGDAIDLVGPPAAWDSLDPRLAERLAGLSLGLSLIAYELPDALASGWPRLARLEDRLDADRRLGFDLTVAPRPASEPPVIGIRLSGERG